MATQSINRIKSKANNEIIIHSQSEIRLLTKILCLSVEHLLDNKITVNFPVLVVNLSCNSGLKDAFEFQF